MMALLGLIGSLLLWYVAMRAVVWSWSRRLDMAPTTDQLTSETLRPPTIGAIVRGHTLGWTVGFTVMFVLLILADFPLGQRIGMSAVLALFFGSVWLSQSAAGEVAEVKSLAHRGSSNVWYWLVAVGDWLGFLLALCFATELVAEVLG